MTLTAATSLIEPGIARTIPGQTWADLGAGNGLFTRALAGLLGKGSTVYAVDKNARILKEIEQHSYPGTVVTLAEDFLQVALGNLDGVIMANSLHFVADKASLLNRLKSMLKPSGRLILVEYNTDRPGPWIPYPIAFGTLEKLAGESGLSVVKLSEQPSRYQPGGMYSALLKKMDM